MQRRRLGRSGLEVAPIAFGGNVFGWTVDEARAVQLLDRFVDAGFNLIDTADVYNTWVTGHAGGESETIIGRWLARSGRRDDVLIATKVGMQMGSGASGLSPEHIRASIDGSLRRLATDHVDLYQAHVDDPAIPLGTTLGELAQHVRDGQVRALGASNYSGTRLSEAIRVSGELGIPRYESLQPLYNLIDRSAYETDLAPVCHAEGLGVLSYSSLASGFLSGKYRGAEDLSKSPRGGRIARRLEPRSLRIAEAVRTVAHHHGVAPTTVALAWVIAQPTITAAIVSATSLEQLEEVLAAATFTLPAADQAELARAGG